jgi:glutaredoxin
MYTRRMGCPFVTLAKRVLADYHVPYREVFIDQDQAARARVLEWTGFLSVPTLVISHDDSDLPYEVPPPLPTGSSPRGINRGSMMTEPGESQLLDWLRQHHLLSDQAAD